jgi:hypothetical protein
MQKLAIPDIIIHISVIHAIPAEGELRVVDRYPITKRQYHIGIDMRSKYVQIVEPQFVDCDGKVTGDEVGGVLGELVEAEGQGMQIGRLGLG